MTPRRQQLRAVVERIVFQRFQHSSTRRFTNDTSRIWLPRPREKRQSGAVSHLSQPPLFPCGGCLARNDRLSRSNAAPGGLLLRCISTSQNDEDDDDDLKDAIHEETSKTAKLSSKRSKGKNKGRHGNLGDHHLFGHRGKDTVPKLLQNHEVHPPEVIEEHFDQLALRTELSRMKYIQKLRKKLANAEDDENISCFALTEQFFAGHKTLPNHVREGFWNLIAASSPASLSMPSEDVSDRALDIVMRSREAAIDNPIFWNHKHKHKVMSEYIETMRHGPRLTLEEKKKLQKEVLPRFQNLRSKELRELHNGKSEDERCNEAKQFAEHLRTHLPPAYHRQLLSTLETFCANEPMASKKNHVSKKREIINLYNKSILASVHSHVHLVAAELVDFLYLTTPTDTMREFPPDPDGFSKTSAACILSTDSNIDKRRYHWKRSREDFVEAFQAVQILLLKEQESQRKSLPTQSQIVTNDSSQSPEDREQDDKDDEIVYDVSEPSALATYDEAAKLPEGTALKPKNLITRRKYSVFVATTVGDLSAHASDISDVEGDSLESTTRDGTGTSEKKTVGCALLTPKDRTVFIDNLPIDIDEHRLLNAFSRCGHIDKIEIFHRRPDLDPGRKTDDSKKKIRKPSSSNRSGPWKRSRTPLYATLSYRDPEGAKKATSDPLRIFGMVLDKHLIRCHEASNMTTLYMEDIPSKYDGESVKNELSRILQPQLVVDLMHESRGPQNKQGGYRNVSIKFQDFESAYWAYLKLSKEWLLLKEGEESSLHWMPTPPDALLYWTRQLNY